MESVDILIEQFLTEGALTKGSQRVMNDKKMVADLADSVRDDARSHPQNFPPNSSRTFQKAPDEEVANWFLESIDKIEAEGYEGTVYSRDGVNNEWIARRYIAGSHNWEDLTGVMNMNFRDFYLLKNRNMLDPSHKDIPKFGSVRDIGSYMSTHYRADLEKVRDAAKNAARNKMAKSVKLVDNDDYRIYTTLNRAAGCLLGLGTQWCTANSNTSTHYHNYSNRAMLFQMFPYAKETDEDGKKTLADNEKYQFDAGGPNFMDITDRPASAEFVRKKFPYLYDDLSKALKTKKPDMEKAFAELSGDATLQGEDHKIKTYEIDDEIEKLGKFVARGYFTEEPRPKKVSSGEEPGAQGQPEVIKPENQPGREQTMENVDKDIAAMMASLKKYDKLTESVAPVLMMSNLNEKKAKPDFLDADKDGDKKEPMKKAMKDKEEVSEEKSDKPWKDSSGKEHSGTAVKGKKYTGKDAEKEEKKGKEDVTEGADAEILEWMGRFAKLGNMKGYGR
jgi:hypothetical protein